ncbi:MAG: hypothetical protein ACO2Z9_06270 [Crocinitomicaceae bacterium]
MIEIQDKRREFFLSIGAAFIVSGLCVLGLSVYVSIFLIVFSIGFFFGKMGVQVDKKSGHYRAFTNVWFTDFGKWRRIKPQDSVKLSLSANNSHMKMGGMENVLIASSKSIYYLITIRGSDGQEDIMRFRSYRRARKTMDALVSNFQLEFLDEIAQKIAENRTKRRTR